MSIIISCFVSILTYNAFIMSNNILETFENPKIDRDYTINFEIPEFTSLCPKTGQPDFANILIEYIFPIKNTIIMYGL